MTVRSMAAVPVLVNVMTALVNDVLPARVFGNKKLSGLITIGNNVSNAPLPDNATETLPAFAVVIVI